MKEFDSLFEIVTQRFIEIFQLGLKQPLQAVRVDNDPFSGPLYTGRIPLRGDGIDGWLDVETDKKFLHETHPERRYGANLEANDYIDWVNEIVNRTLAGSKPAIYSLGWSLRLEQPTAVQGTLAPESPTKFSATVLLESMGFYARLSLCFTKLDIIVQKAI